MYDLRGSLSAVEPISIRPAADECAQRFAPPVAGCGTPISARSAVLHIAFQHTVLDSTLRCVGFPHRRCQRAAALRDGAVVDHRHAGAATALADAPADAELPLRLKSPSTLCPIASAAGCPRPARSEQTVMTRPGGPCVRFVRPGRRFARVILDGIVITHIEAPAAVPPLPCSRDRPARDHLHRNATSGRTSAAVTPSLRLTAPLRIRRRDGPSPASARVETARVTLIFSSQRDLGLVGQGSPAGRAADKAGARRCAGHLGPGLGALARDCAGRLRGRLSAVRLDVVRIRERGFPRRPPRARPRPGRC